MSENLDENFYVVSHVSLRSRVSDIGIRHSLLRNDYFPSSHCFSCSACTSNILLGMMSENVD